jgi:hypothetical protein
VALLDSLSRKRDAGDCYTGGVRRARIVLLATLALAGAAGCVSSQETGKPFPASARHKLVVNRTTKPEAQKLLGPAVTTTTAADGRDRWTYEYTRVSARRLNPFARHVTVRQTPYEQLVLTFHDGILRECTYLAETYRTEDGLILPAERIREACGVR